jgi:hypothetical protein
MTQKKDKSQRGSTRNTKAQTSRQEAMAVELIRRAFASPYGRLYDDVPGPEAGRRGGFKEANVDRGVLQRQNVDFNWPHPDDGWVQDRGEWGDRESRRIRQYHDSHPEARRLAEARSRPPMTASSRLNGRDFDPLDPQYQPHYAQPLNYNQGFHGEQLIPPGMDKEEGLREALVRIFGR